MDVETNSDALIEQKRHVSAFLYHISGSEWVETGYLREKVYDRKILGPDIQGVSR